LQLACSHECILPSLSFFRVKLLYSGCKSVFKPNVSLKFNLASRFRAHACSQDAQRFISCIKNEWHYLFFFPPSLSEKVLSRKTMERRKKSDREGQKGTKRKSERKNKELPIRLKQQTIIKPRLRRCKKIWKKKKLRVATKNNYPRKKGNKRP